MQKAKRLKKLMQAQRGGSGGSSCTSANCGHDHSLSPFGIPIANLNAGIERSRARLALAEKTLPPSAFEEWKGQFWAIPETQEFMNAKSELAQLLRMRGDISESVVHLRELVELNPRDNQGNRWHLWTALIDLSKAEPDALDELEFLLTVYEEPMAATVYSKALGLLRKGGASPEAKAALKHAFAKNSHVVHLLNRAYPELRLSKEVALGSLEEAYGYVLQSWHQWRETDGWKEFLATAKDP